MNKYVTTKRIYIGTLVLVLISFLYPPFYTLKIEGRWRPMDESVYGWSLINNLEFYQAVNFPLLFTELVILGIVAFLLIKIIGEQ